MIGSCTPVSNPPTVFVLSHRNCPTSKCVFHLFSLALSRRQAVAYDGPAFVELGLSISPDVRVSLRRKLNEAGQVERLDVVQDPDGTSWDLLQAGAGYYYGTMEHCKRVGKLIVELRRPTDLDTPVAKAILAVGTISVNLQTSVVRCGVGLDAIPCTGTEAVWRQLAVAEDGKIMEKRRVPYRRIGMVVAFAHKLTVAQRALLQKVCPCGPWHIFLGAVIKIEVICCCCCSALMLSTVLVPAVPCIPL